MVTQEVVVTVPGMSTSAYSANDQVGTLITVPGAGIGGGSGCKLAQVTVVDKSKQSAALNMILFSSAPTVASADNAGVDVADAQIALYGQGVVKVATGDYVALAGSSIATVATGWYVKPDAAGTIYALLSTTGTPTFGVATDLVLRLLFVWD